MEKTTSAPKDVGIVGAPALPEKVLHLLSRLEIGGLERGALRLGLRARRMGWDHSLLLFDKPFRSNNLDFSPENIPTDFFARCSGVDIKFAWRLARHLKQRKIGIVHAYNDTAIFYAALAILISRRSISLIGTFGTRPSYDTTGARLLTRWASTRASKIVAKSQELADWLVSSKWVKQCIVIANGIDLEEFSTGGSAGRWRDEFSIPSAAVLVGHVGRFDPIKDHASMLLAAEILQGVGLGVPPQL
jgi:glycosyltransferase involved in cell wall biosynthesis